ncbi:MAG TPA: hypothetical protein VF377_06790 [Acidimicrobiia bacterium]
MSLDATLVDLLNQIAGVERVHVTRYSKGQWQINLNGAGADDAVELWIRALEGEVYPLVVRLPDGSIRRMVAEASDAKRTT